MNRSVRGLVLLAFLFCLLSVLCACGDDPAPDRDNPAINAEALSQSVPEPIADRLELDRVEIGGIYVKDGALYFRAQDLGKVWEPEITEPAENVLRLQLNDTTLTLQNGSNKVSAQAGTILLGAPVVCAGSDWYLPLDALKSLWGRAFVYDRTDGLLRFLRLEDGPAVRVAGTSVIGSRLFGGEAVAQADLFSALSGGVTEASVEPDGSPVLTLCAGEHRLLFREGALEAEADGNRLALPSSVWREGETWYLPITATAEALGCTAVLENVGEHPELFLAVEGRDLWFSGVYSGHTYDFSGVPCASLPILTEALNGTLRESADSVVLKALGRTLVFRAGSQQMLADGETLSLPIPALRAEGEWFVPLHSVASALHIPDRSNANGLIFSRIEPQASVLLVNGIQTEAFSLPDRVCRVRLRDVAEASGGSFLADKSSAELRIWGRSAALEGGSGIVSVDGSELSLRDVVLADGDDWYAPAELLQYIGFSEFRDPELDRTYYTHIVKNDALAEGYRVPVFMYHAVSDYIWGNTELFVSPSELEAQLQALTEGGYTPITFEDLDRVAEIEKPVLLTFDDGYDDNYTELFPLLKKYNVKATVFVIVNDIGKIHKLTEAQIREMSDSGLVSIQSHTLSHGYLDAMYPDQLHKEHYGSMLKLTRITGKQPFVMCYPTGRSTYYSQTITAEYYEFGLCMGGPCYVTGAPPYMIYRYYVPRFLPLSTFLSYLEAAA